MGTNATELRQTNPNHGDMGVDPGEWAVTNAPAAASAATITKAAPASLASHVCRGISASMCSPAGSTPGTSPVILQLKDGTTIVWQMKVIPPPAASASIDGNWSLYLSGLNIVGSAGKAMTLEFSAGGGTNVVQTVSMTGYTASP